MRRSETNHRLSLIVVVAIVVLVAVVRGSGNG